MYVDLLGDLYPPWTCYNDMNCIECLMNQKNYPISPRISTIVVLQLHWSLHWFHSNLAMIGFGSSHGPYIKFIFENIIACMDDFVGT